MKNSRKKRRDAFAVSKLSWEDAYALPLHKDKYGTFVWDRNGNMALSFGLESISEKEFCVHIKDINEIVSCINGESESENKGRWSHDVCDFMLDGKFIFSVRGWGNLTGCGALNLPGNVAARIQDGFIKYIFDRLNGNKNAE